MAQLTSQTWWAWTFPLSEQTQSTFTHQSSQISRYRRILLNLRNRLPIQSIWCTQYHDHPLYGHHVCPPCPSGSSVRCRL
jgi:hypothetical protein